jgi:biopolymer transport protein ExbB
MSIPRNMRQRFHWFLLATIVWVAWALGSASWPAVGQEKEKVKEKPAAAKAVEKKAAPAPAPVAAPAAEEAKPAAAASAPEGRKRISALQWFIEASGLVGLLILGLSVYFVATIGRLFWELRIQVAVPPEIAGRCQDLLAQRNFKGVFDVVKGDDSVFSRMLSHGIAELPNGLAEARDVMERVGESIRVEMEKRISVLAVLGTLGPMIGLVGTLMGMIRAFGEIAQGGADMDSQRIASAISMALVITLEGVSLSVPSIWFFSLFRNRVSVITTNVSVEADQFLRHFAHAARAKTPATAGAAAATGAPGARAIPRAE